MSVHNKNKPLGSVWSTAERQGWERSDGGVHVPRVDGDWSTQSLQYCSVSEWIQYSERQEQNYLIILCKETLAPFADVYILSQYRNDREICI